MVKQKTKILIVDDEEAISEGLRSYLELEGYTVDAALSAEKAIELDLPSYDIMLLDIMMEGISGTELASKLKANPDTADIPIIFLTAKDSVDDMVAGLSLGADDYIAKPFAIKNVMARIEAVLRRSSHKQQTSAGKKGVICDRLAMTCTVDGVPVKLPKKEFEILALLLEHPGRVFSREELLARIWPEHVIITDRSVDVHVTRLRSKIAPYDKHIFTRSGYGYGWQD